MKRLRLAQCWSWRRPSWPPRSGSPHCKTKRDVIPVYGRVAGRRRNHGDVRDEMQIRMKKVKNMGASEKQPDGPPAVIRWGVFRFGPWRLCLAATERGLAHADRVADGQTDEDAAQTLKQWAKRRAAGAELVRDESALGDYRAQYDEYFKGKRKRFTFPLDLCGTPFQRDVWEALTAIPYGKTVAYADIAARIGKPAAVRACGGAIGQNPVLIAVPCHRVIGKNGALTGFSSGLDMKAWLLGHEAGRAVV